MSIPLLLSALVLHQAPSFQAPMTVAEPQRLAITPKLDGVIEDEEWDPLTTAGSKSYFQWEPGKLHVAAVTPAGNDLVISIDLKSNGWLVGKDNLEVRVTADGKVSGRLLDATQVSGPVWVDVPGLGMNSTAAVKTDGGNTTFEVTLADAGLGLFPIESGSGLSLRVDPVATGSPAAEPFVPRVLSPVKLALSRAAAMPTGLKWGVEGAGNRVLPGDDVRVRLTFNGDEKLHLKRIAMRSEGLARTGTAELSRSFPEFDKKGRAFVDYSTDMPKDALVGYRVLRGSVTGADDVTGVMQVSYRVAPVLEVDLVRQPIVNTTGNQTARLTYYLRSNSPRRVDGNVTIVPPQGYRILNGNDKGFIIYTPRGSVRRRFELEIPAGARGVVPITFRVEMGGKVTDEVGYANVG